LLSNTHLRGARVTDVFISYSQRERELMLPLYRRLEALGLILFVDLDGRLDECSPLPEALEEGIRTAKAVLGCWSPQALTSPRVQAECAIAKEENKLVAAERLGLSPSQVPALFTLAGRKPLTDFVEDQPHEGWAATLAALAAKLRLWAERRPSQPEASSAIAKAALLDKAAAAEWAALAQTAGVGSAGAAKPATPSHSGNPVAQAWAAIEAGLTSKSYRQSEQAFATDPATSPWGVETEARDSGAGGT
jgi:hypothetical protein